MRVKHLRMPRPLQPWRCGRRDRHNLRRRRAELVHSLADIARLDGPNMIASRSRSLSAIKQNYARLAKTYFDFLPSSLKREMSG